MKKIILYIALMFVSFSIMAQFRGKDTAYDNVLSDGKTAYFITGTAADTTGTADSTLTKTIFVNTNVETICDLYMDVDSLGGTAGIANAHYFILQYKEFPDEAYTALDTITYAGTVDTTFRITSTTAVKARYWRILEKGITDELKLKTTKWYFKFWY